VFSSLVTLVRHTAAVTAVVLVWGGAQTAPAAAAPSDAVDAVVGHHVYVDIDHDGQWSQGDQGVPGARLSIRGPDGKPPQGVDATQTTDEHGDYHFDHVEAGVRYTVTLDLTSVDLTKLAPLSSTDGGWDPGATTWSLSTGESSDTWDSINFGFSAKLPLALHLYDLAPTMVVGPVPIEGLMYNAHGIAFGWAGPVSVEFRAGGTTTWTELAHADADDQGRWRVSPTLRRSGWIRYRFAGDRYAAAGVSREIHVVVTTAPVLLDAQAPATVPRGQPLKVTGSITRSDRPFTTGRIVLERSTDATTWTKVADLSSTEGKLAVTVQPAVTGAYRFRYAGDSASSPATSPARPVVVLNAAGTPSGPPLRR
jgi:hypothetical protein